MDHVIPETPFTIDFVLEQIKNSKWHKGCDLKNLISYESKEIGKGVAFLSRIMRLNFSWNDPTIRPTSIVLKVPGIQDYKKLMPANSSKEELEYLDDQGERHLEVAHGVPKFFYGHQYSRQHNKGLMILEDLSIRASTMRMFPGLTNEQVFIVYLYITTG
uniref:Uncharacterized protein n=1 Tax=Acrobeloides nanus TaxID=290746 RepID=A0A914DUF6_9BILA